MGAYIEINDTLRITKEQGFPSQLDIQTHLKKPYSFKDFKDKVFKFSSKPKIRVFKIPPVRDFLVEEVDGKWIYWGLCHIIEVNMTILTNQLLANSKSYISIPQKKSKKHMSL